jgi:hypothetical protein
MYGINLNNIITNDNEFNNLNSCISNQISNSDITQIRTNLTTLKQSLNSEPSSLVKLSKVADFLNNSQTLISIQNITNILVKMTPDQINCYYGKKPDVCNNIQNDPFLIGVDYLYQDINQFVLNYSTLIANLTHWFYTVFVDNVGVLCDDGSNNIPNVIAESKQVINQANMSIYDGFLFETFAGTSVGSPSPSSVQSGSFNQYYTTEKARLDTCANNKISTLINFTNSFAQAFTSTNINLAAMINQQGQTLLTNIKAILVFLNRADIVLMVQNICITITSIQPQELQCMFSIYKNNCSQITSTNYQPIIQLMTNLKTVDVNYNKIISQLIKWSYYTTPNTISKTCDTNSKNTTASKYIKQFQTLLTSANQISHNAIIQPLTFYQKITQPIIINIKFITPAMQQHITPLNILLVVLLILLIILAIEMYYSGSKTKTALEKPAETSLETTSSSITTDTVNDMQQPLEAPPAYTPPPNETVISTN